MLQTAFAIAFQLLLFADFRLVRCLQQTVQQTHSLRMPAPRTAPLRMCPLRVQLRQWHATSVALTACNMSDFCCTFWSAAQSIGGPYAVMQLALATLSGCQTPHSPAHRSMCVCLCVSVCAKEFIVENYQEANIFAESNFKLVALGQQQRQRQRQAASNVCWQDFCNSKQDRER